MTSQSINSELLSPLFQRILEELFDSFQILHVKRSFTNEIVDFSILFESTPRHDQTKLRRLSDYRMLYTLKKSLNSTNISHWINLHDSMLLPLSQDEILVVTFDPHNHNPNDKLLAIAMGFDGVTHVVGERISQRLISSGLDSLSESGRPFAFGIINFDDFESDLPHLNQSQIHLVLDDFAHMLKTKLGNGGVVASLRENEFALLLKCERNIDEIFSNLTALSQLSITRSWHGEHEKVFAFSAGYVFVDEPVISTNEILEEAFALMYQCKSDGKNSYNWSYLHHSASDPSI